MFKKIITLLIALSIFSGQAIATTGSGLKKAYDELNYSLTVEWDQNDESFYNEQMAVFTAKVQELKSEGLTQSELINFSKLQLKNAKSNLDLDAALKVIQANKLTTSEANSYILQALKGSHSSGASWAANDDMYLWGSLLGLVVVGLVLLDSGDL
jgi:uncharacterized protein YoaH (UPF0181 family)